MTVARSTVVKAAEPGIYHCVSRCVRRAFLCGRDRWSGKDFDHRRAWIRDRLKELCGIFAVEVLAYAVMANHLHVVVRCDPLRPRQWSFEEAARRWCRLFPLERDGEGKPVEPSAQALRHHFAAAGREALCRERLGSLSWFMRCLNEPIARRANREDRCGGRFWEGRFKCLRLEDPGATLACMAYVDLNPVRAGLAECPEQSDFTSFQDRVKAEGARRALESLGDGSRGSIRKQSHELAAVHREAGRDGWLASLGETLGGETDPLPGVSLERYLQLVDWTGRNLRRAMAGRIPSHLAPLLGRMELDASHWIATVEGYGGLYYRVAGTAQNMIRAARQAGQKWFRGLGATRKVYGSASAGTTPA